MPSELPARIVARCRPSNLRAAWWTWRSLRRARSVLAADGVRAVLAAPPVLPSGAAAGVDAVLRRSSATCLEQSLVRQSWLGAHGHDVDVIVGVPRAGFAARSVSAALDPQSSAHAWLATDTDATLAERYVEIYRFAAK